MSSDGSTFYGTTTAGGLNDEGGIFSVPVGGGTITNLTSFSIANGGYTTNPDPSGLALSSDGSTLYGTYSTLAPSQDGVVFSFPTGVPEPGSVTLLLTGLLVVALRRRRAAV